MEDEEGERKVMDMWSILGEQQMKDQSYENVLKHTLDNSCTESGEEDKQIIQYNSVTTKDSPSKNSSPGSKIVFKGFKKRILAQAQENETASSNNTGLDQQLTNTNVSPKAKEKRPDSKRGKITEYAQYLGLQPSTKTKCSKCQSSASFCSPEKQSQCSCKSNMAPMPSTSESPSTPNASNFKITRKVYLCAACGTYFENWNLFLHMRDIHKRHICLFCLGMFGQAERLSHHLIKKHSVPEMGFASVEDFYGAFKGSCYLVCCSCEKVFSETDNFYNHFCSPATKQDVTASICTLCRQTGTHASTCSLAIERSKETHSAVPPSTIGTSIPSHILDRSMIAGSKNRRIIKNNRTKFPDDSVPNSLQQKHLKKTSNKSIPESSPDAQDTLKDENPQIDITHNSLRDTVSETIMEVSRCIEDSIEENENRIDQDRCQERIQDVESPTKETSSKESYDSITETIMEVSQCTNLETIEAAIKKEDTSTCETLDSSEKPDSDTENLTKDTSFDDSAREMDDRPTTPMDDRPETIEEDANEEKSEEISETKTDTSSQPPDSPVHSPISRSLFSPQHEPLAPDLQSTEEESPEKKYDEPESTPPAESQTSVSFNAIPCSDRSLVIKICTNRNSQFSVTSATITDTTENHDASLESEENNNADGSPSEHVSNLSEREKDGNDSYLANEGDSDDDSDSFKLAVVDSNPEATGDAEDIEDTRPTTDSNLEPNMIAISNTSYTEESGNDKTLVVDGRYDINGKVQDSTSQDSKANLAVQPNDGIVLAGDDVPCVDLNVEGTLDSIEIEELLKGCIDAASPYCVYCNHARHIAVNGKQLGLHMLAEHKFQPQHPAIIIQPEQFIIRVKKSLDELDPRFFNLDSYSSTNGTYNIPSVRTYECFHCRYYSTVHKELYLHNRKMHQKTILICIMCKSTFYSYSELLCHLCPGIYSPNINVRYRCCLCSVTNLPSAFRLMVHLRKRHHACDVCLEPTGNQQRLSNHVWKHKLHHLCYRCGIAYRNKPDITKHLFWKHGTESVLCKKCLQKKWPHIYHFCIPPTAFVCEECGSSFSRAVALKVHKRLHTGDLPHPCTECSERFISKKLLAKHEDTHREQPTIDVAMTDARIQPIIVGEEKTEKEKSTLTDSTTGAVDSTKETKETVKKVVDVYDLPPLNLSSESDTDSEDEKPEPPKETATVEKETVIDTSEAAPTEAPKPESPVAAPDSIVEVEQDEEEKKQEAEIMDGIWDNFKTYTANLEKQESANNFAIKEPDLEPKLEPEPEPETDVAYLRSIVLADHDYCVVYSEKDKNGEQAIKEEGNAGDQDHPNRSERSPSNSNALQTENDSNKKKVKSPKKKKQGGTTSSSDSSSDSDSSSCSCGTNCSCSSSSSGSSSTSSSSSDSDSSGSESSPKKQSSRKERKKEKETTQEARESAEPESKEICVEVENGAPGIPLEPICPLKQLLRESDLETDETETDEDFYDEHPQQLANKLLAEKRNQLLLLAAVAPASVDSAVPLNNGVAETDTAVPSPEPISTHVNISEEQPQQKRKVKTKKRKKGERNKQRNATPTVESIKLNIPKAFYQKTPGYSTPSPGMMTLQPSRSSTPNIVPNDIHLTSTPIIQQTPMTHQTMGDVTPGQENKRFSKRKRVPKRFYGDSSDEEQEKQPAIKWRKVETPSYVPTPTLKTIPPRVSFAGRGMVYRPPPVEPSPQNITVAAAASATESEEPVESSSESSDSEAEPVQPQPLPPPTNPPPAAPERNVNLYCYCQCPYDEVSEMIACDGEDCRIEWFHFECVGIMVPPKGKWYCPDCRKKHGIVTNSEDYFD